MSGTSFSVGMYNILGRTLSPCRWYSWARHFLPDGAMAPEDYLIRDDTLAGEYLKWNGAEGRLQLLVDTIDTMNVDVLGCVEVDSTQFIDAVQRKCCSGRFHKEYLQRPNGREDGCCLFFNSELFTCKQRDELVYPDGSERVALCVQLCHNETEQCIWFVVTHLHWAGPDYHDIELESLKRWWQKTNKADPTSQLVVLGDLNAGPSTTTVNFFTNTLQLKSAFQDTTTDPTNGSNTVTAIQPLAFYKSPDNKWVIQDGRIHHIDWIFFSGGLAVGDVCKLPTRQYLKTQPKEFWCGEEEEWELDPCTLCDRADLQWRPDVLVGEHRLGIPNQLHGSDHLPVACVLELRPGP
eukprot:TRINITY_DN62541_c0_g1_i1.p1 TRINITY_DN62541_c0_g1~~TRINITY_DN62541_c0_g1_i1.p1  ORF type:complete len:369 (+),score=31.18 TRINITY_DN62541_c0_g1_i1:57-1109(+)